MSKVFTPEKVRELSKRMVDQLHIGHTPFFILSEWLEQNPIEPVVVGLSDEQVDKFERSLSYKSGGFVVLLRDFLRTQTFAQTRAFDDSELSEKYMTLYDDYQSLLIDFSLQKKQQFLPNWDKIPVHADWYFVSESYCENEPTLNCVIYKEQRPKQTPAVEVGQVWRCAKTEVIVIALNDDDVVFQKVITKGFDVYSTIDFLAKFERVE